MAELAPLGFLERQQRPPSLLATATAEVSDESPPSTSGQLESQKDDGYIYHKASEQGFGLGKDEQQQATSHPRTPLTLRCCPKTNEGVTSACAILQVTKLDTLAGLAIRYHVTVRAEQSGVAAPVLSEAGEELVVWVP